LYVVLCKLTSKIFIILTEKEQNKKKWKNINFNVLQFIRRNCFLGRNLKRVFVWDRVFSITVASIVTNSLFKIGRPTRVKSVLPTSNTFSNFKRSPIFGGQYPSIIIISFSVTLNCFPHTCTTANIRPILFIAICLLISFVTSVSKRWNITHFEIYSKKESNTEICARNVNDQPIFFLFFHPIFVILFDDM